MSHSFAPHRAGGFSLVVTLIIVSMLAVVAIGFLASMSNERATADAYGNKTRAEQAAQAGADSAIAILRQAFKDFPDSATVWETHSVNKDGAPVVDSDHPVALANEGTTLYVRAMPDGSSPTDPLPDPTADNSPGHTVSATDASDARSVFVLPLISGARYQQKNQFSAWTNPANKPKLDPTTNKSFADQYVDLNVRRAKDDSQGWLGSPLRPPPANAKPLPPRTVRVPWVNVTQADAAAGTIAPVVARYAFWVEDESFRANVNYAGTGDAPLSSTRVRQDNSSGSWDVKLPLNAKVVDLFGPLRALFDASVAAPLAQSLSEARKVYPDGFFSEGLGYTHAAGLSVAQADALRFLTTTTSGGLNLSRHGTQRVNLNQLIYPKPDASGTATTYSAQEQIVDIVKTIQFHAPNFGQRFYRNVPNAKAAGAVDPAVLNDMFVPDDNRSHRLMYLYKIATNIKDYIDKDSVPTFVDGVKDDATGKYTGSVHTGPYMSNTTPPAIIYPNPGAGDGNLIWAQGKDSGPYMDECAVRFSGGITTNGSPNKYSLRTDYYVEVWNPTNKDVSALYLPGLKVHIANQTPWQAANTTTPITYTDLPVDGNIPTPSGDPRARDLDMLVPEGAVFKAGKATVLTTDPHFNTPPDTSPMPLNFATMEGLKNFVYCQVAGTIAYSGTMPSGKTRIVFKGRQTGGFTSDYDTEVTLYCTNGLVDCAPGPMPIYSGSSSTPIFIGNGSSTSNPDHTGYKAYGGSLRANGGVTNSTPEPTVTGDPRSNNEQLTNNPKYQSGTTINQGRYYNFGANPYVDANPNNPIYPGTLGLPNSDFTQPDNGGGTFTPWPDYYKFPAGAQPVMNASNALMNVANAEITSIGQLGDVYDPARAIGTDLSKARGGGRTLKIGQPDDLWDGNYRSASRSWAAWRLADFFGVNDAMVQPGLININGVARDNGAALRAALTGFKYQENLPSDTLVHSEKLPLVAETSTLVPPTQGLDTLVYQIKKRLAPDPGSITTGTVGTPGGGDSTKPDYAPYNTGQGPFWERGEFSELPAFGRTNVAASNPAASYTGADLVSGAVTNQTFDRGREEVFRRLAEMITTRGNVFTVYAIGQTISPKVPTNGQTLAVTSTQRLKVTFRLIPKTGTSAGGTGGTTASTAATNVDFHPATLTGVGGVQYPVRFTPDTATATGRFAKPHHYDIEILSASKGGG